MDESSNSTELWNPSDSMDDRESNNQHRRNVRPVLVLYSNQGSVEDRRVHLRERERNKTTMRQRHGRDETENEGTNETDLSENDDTSILST